MKKEYVICDNCGNKWDACSPPPKEAYENGAIHVQKLTILLPPNLVAKLHRNGYGDSHATDITDADFCNFNCLKETIRKILDGHTSDLWNPNRI